MKILKIFTVSIFLIYSSFLAADNTEKNESSGPNMRLLKPAYAFHICVDSEINRLLLISKKSDFKNGAEAEGLLFNKVIDKCFSEITNDENQGMIYQNYEGNLLRMTDYRDGLLFYARAYVLSQVISWFESTE